MSSCPVFVTMSRPDVEPVRDDMKRRDGRRGLVLEFPYKEGAGLSSSREIICFPLSDNMCMGKRNVKKEYGRVKCWWTGFLAVGSGAGTLRRLRMTFFFETSGDR